MKCLKCDKDVENDDNFCYSCGHWTARGYMFLKDKSNVKLVMRGSAIRQDNRLFVLIGLLSVTFLLFIVILMIRGKNLFKPYVFLKKQVFNYIYGYNTSLIVNNNKYNNEIVDSYDSAINFIKRDFDDQSWQCYSDYRVFHIEDNIEEKYSISSVNFCDINYEEASRIQSVIERMFELFPGVSGALSNITITNAPTLSEYIAYFQPMYQFVNIDEDINFFNKVNKTQILLNSYYFLNDSSIQDDWYVFGATLESTIAHELGHYISFKLLLSSYNIDNIFFVTKDNYDLIDEVINEFNSGDFSMEIVNEALDNYNVKYNKSLDVFDFVLMISKYAGVMDANGDLIYDEVIAEAIHDYYLHGDGMCDSSREIVNVVKRKLECL